MSRPFIEDDKNREEDKQNWGNRPLPPTPMILPTNVNLVTPSLLPSIFSGDNGVELNDYMNTSTPITTTNISNSYEGPGPSIMRKGSIVDMYGDFDDIPFIGTL